MISKIYEKNFFGLLWFLKKLFRVGSGWPKRPQVGLNFRSVLGPSHPYKTILILLRTLFSDSEQALYKKVWKMGKKI